MQPVQDYENIVSGWLLVFQLLRFYAGTFVPSVSLTGVRKILVANRLQFVIYSISRTQGMSPPFVRDPAGGVN